MPSVYPCCPLGPCQELNLQDEGWELHYGQKLERSQVQRVWSELKKSSDFEARRVEVDAYNAQHRWRKRGLAMIPTKFGISFTAKHLNQVPRPTPHSHPPLSQSGG